MLGISSGSSARASYSYNRKGQGTTLTSADHGVIEMFGSLCTHIGRDPVSVTHLMCRFSKSCPMIMSLFSEIGDPIFVGNLEEGGLVRLFSIEIRGQHAGDLYRVFTSSASVCSFGSASVWLTLTDPCSKTRNLSPREGSTLLDRIQIVSQFSAPLSTGQCRIAFSQSP